MPLFLCSNCGCYDNTAVTNYWTRNINALRTGKEKKPPLCSECDPEIGQWHNRFPKASAKGMLIGEDGFLHDKEQFERGMINHTKMIGEVG